MRRRDFISFIGVSAVVWPLPVHAQQAAIPVIGFLNSASADAYEGRVDAFRQGLAETGYVEGRNVAIEYRWANNQTNQLPRLADELLRRKVAVIIANGPAAFPAKTATTTIPIVFTAGFDPVQLGLVTSLNRPGGNLTGISILNEELGPKRLELLPTQSRLACSSTRPIPVLKPYREPYRLRQELSDCDSAP
jgi:putative ABC transport system substrate-binding protein